MMTKPEQSRLPYSDFSDDDLIVSFLEGHDGAFEEIYSRYSEKILAFLVVEVGRTWAEDIAQETFSKLLSALPKYQPQGKFSSFLYCIARNLAKDAHRKAKDLIPLDTIEQWIEDKSNPVDIHLDQEFILEAIQALRSDQRQVILLRAFAGMSFAEIAKRTNKPLGTVLSQGHRAIKALRSRYGTSQTS